MTAALTAARRVFWSRLSDESCLEPTNISPHNRRKCPAGFCCLTSSPDHSGPAGSERFGEADSGDRGICPRHASLFETPPVAGAAAPSHGRETQRPDAGGPNQEEEAEAGRKRGQEQARATGVERGEDAIGQGYARYSCPILSVWDPGRRGAVICKAMVLDWTGVWRNWRSTLDWAGAVFVTGVSADARRRATADLGHVGMQGRGFPRWPAGSRAGNVCRPHVRSLPACGLLFLIMEWQVEWWNGG